MSNFTVKALSEIIHNMPSDWLKLTTHRIDIYNEKLAKVEFLEKLEALTDLSAESLAKLPTAYDYIRLGHPLSCVLEWALANSSGLGSESVISFSSQVMPLLAVLRKNKFLNKKTAIVYSEGLPQGFDGETLKNIYEYDFELIKVEDFEAITHFEGSALFINAKAEHRGRADFNLITYPKLGSVIEVLSGDSDYIKEIQHVRRRESIAMTPQNCLSALKAMTEISEKEAPKGSRETLNKTIRSITHAATDAALSSCGLSVQYSIMMGLIHFAKEEHAGKSIKFIVPPNCYGGTNDQARRVAACISNVEIVDLPVDSGKDMVIELKRILDECALSDSVPYIIAEIPTNPRVEIPDLVNLRETLRMSRKTSSGSEAISAVFILDQTFCPNVLFFGEKGHLRDVAVISYVSGSKFPSGGLCTAGYAVANESAANYMEYIQKHLLLCDNEATDLQIEILTKEMPSMNERIARAYQNTRAFVDHIEKTLPEAKINFVTEELADAHFTPSVFSLDLPTKGESHEERENYKRELNHRLIGMMIEALPEESKYCVSYGQLKGCYWTIPATSTQGTTKESDKDYIVRVSVAADFNLEKHCEVFSRFVETL